ncbi:unnamed protein product, partial [Linum tenue]
PPALSPSRPFAKKTTLFSALCFSKPETPLFFFSSIAAVSLLPSLLSRHSLCLSVDGDGEGGGTRWQPLSLSYPYPTLFSYPAIETNRTSKPISSSLAAAIKDDPTEETPQSFSSSRRLLLSSIRRRSLKIYRGTFKVEEFRRRRKRR